MSAIDGHRFNLATKSLQDSAVDLALKEVEKYKEQGLVSTSVKCGRFARKICRDVYTNFKQNLSEQFPSEGYKDLVSLTLKSRTNFFFLDLQDRVKELLLDSKEVTSVWNQGDNFNKINLSPSSKSTCFQQDEKTNTTT